MASEDLHTAGIALGSNLGDSFALIELALRMLEDPDRRRLAGLPPTATVVIVNTSFLYETAPMYVTDQPKFINGACMVCRSIFVGKSGLYEPVCTRAD